MTIRLSTGARNLLSQGQGFGAMFNKGYIEIYSGAQPVSADAAETGTLLGVVSVNGAALTKETRATGSVTLTGGASGSINTVTVGGLNIIPDGAVAFNTSLNQTASDLADAINRNGIMEATAAAAVVTLRGRPGTGVTTAAVTATLTTVTATYVNMGSGVAGIAPVNALNLATPSLGIITKPTNQVWNFQGVAAGTAGWFRFYSSDTADTGLLLTGAPWYPRLDGSIATSGADLNLSQIVIAVASSNTIDTFSLTVPAQ